MKYAITWAACLLFSVPVQAERQVFSNYGNPKGNSADRAFVAQFFEDYDFDNYVLEQMVSQVRLDMFAVLSDLCSRSEMENAGEALKKSSQEIIIEKRLDSKIKEFLATTDARRKTRQLAELVLESLSEAEKRELALFGKTSYTFIKTQVAHTYFSTFSISNAQPYRSIAREIWDNKCPFSPQPMIK